MCTLEATKGGKVIFRGLITLTLLFGLTLVGFGHRTVSPQDSVQLESYVLAGGDIASLCEDTGAPVMDHGECRACLIAASCLLPSATTTITPVGAIIAQVAIFDGQPVLRPAGFALPQSRAPPAFV